MEEKEFEIGLKKIISIEERKKQKVFLQSVEKSVEKSRKTKWLIAASILLFFGISGYFFINKSKSDEKLFAQYFSSYPNVVAPITRDDFKKNSIEIAFENYELENYNVAVSSFDEMIKTEPVEIEILQFYKAICLLNLDKTVEAIDIFNTNLTNSKIWRDKHLWYLSLAHLKNKNVDLAIKNLRILSKEKTNFKRNETLELLKSLK